MSENNLHILLVDDDDKIRELLKTFLVDNKYLVSTASNAAEAKEVLKYITFDLLVIDIMMPGQNGYELTKEIKNIKTAHDIDAIALTKYLFWLNTKLINNTLNI